MKNIAVVFMVAGMSSRFGGKPKHLTKVGPNHETLIEISLDQALTAPFTQIVFIVSNESKKQLSKLFGFQYRHLPITYVLQTYKPSKRDRPWGTNDAVSQLVGHVDCPVVICNGDDLYGSETFQICVKKMIEHDENVTIGFKLKNVLPDQGKVNRGFYSTYCDGNGLKYIDLIKEMLAIEKSTFNPKQLESLVSMNFIGLKYNTLGWLNEINTLFKMNHSNDRNIECFLPAAISELISQKKIQLALFPTNEKWYGITNPGDELKIVDALASAP